MTRMESISPIDGSVLGSVEIADTAALGAAIGRADEAFRAWRLVPPPRRGELVRLFGDALREEKEALGRLVSTECGKILSEGLGEVQEMIDICDFAVGLSRQLYGLTIATERPGHRMMETWHPLGVVGVISAFNFPVAVWAWNACLAFVCGDSVVWKPSEKTPLCAQRVAELFARAAGRFGDAPAGLLELVQGGREIGAALGQDARWRSSPATARRRGPSARPARRGAVRAVAARARRQHATRSPPRPISVSPSGDRLSAMGTAGQRCTSLRRLIVHAGIYDVLVPRLSGSGRRPRSAIRSRPARWSGR